VATETLINPLIVEAVPPNTHMKALPPITEKKTEKKIVANEPR